MARTILREGPDKDQFLAKLAKYIPAEMTALFLFSSGIIDGMNLDVMFYWGFFVFIVLFSPIYFLLAATMEGKKPDKAQVIISPFAAVVWVAAIGGPFSKIKDYNPGYALLFLGLFTTIVPFVDFAIGKYWPQIRTLFSGKKPQKVEENPWSSTNS